MRRPIPPNLQRLAARVPGMSSRLDPEEAAEYEEATRVAFRAAVREAGARLEDTGTRERAMTTTPTAKSFPRPEPLLPVDGAGDDPTGQRGRARTDPSEGMQASTSATRVADDFFDGLVKRVEGGR